MLLIVNTKLSYCLIVFVIVCHQFVKISTNCQNAIYCTGKLLHTIQMANVFKDSKVFVDMYLIDTIESTIQDFNDMMIYTNQKPNTSDIRNFIKTHFGAENSELELWKPDDFRTDPKFLKHIDDPTIRTFAKQLVELWLKLSRRIRSNVIHNSKQYSIIPVPNGFIIPGGRFREYYYWDSYWIVKGLLISDMTTTVRGILENFFVIINRYGFMPNGGRIYYLDRSQPPVLTMMVYEFIKKTNDKEWLRRNINYLEQELHFWLDKKCVKVRKNGQIYQMAHYRSSSDDPRPESYRKDVQTASVLKTMNEKRCCYRSIRTGCESGWDFSFRWLVDVDQNRPFLARMDPARFVPVDLNAILARSFRILSDFYTIQFNDLIRADYWRNLAVQFEDAIENILYWKRDGIWYDYDVKLAKQRRAFFPTNLTPLWTLSFNLSDHDQYCVAAQRYLNEYRIREFDGGVPSSLHESGEQWDLPNAWAPIQSIVIFGLAYCKDLESRKLARELAQKWIQNNLKTYEKSNEMFEKYNAIYPGVQGKGGEYEVQTGFGWSNGVLLELIEYYYVQNKNFK